MSKYFLIFICNISSAPPVERWSKFEVSFKGSATGNPFTDGWITATFKKEQEQFKVDGFYEMIV